MILQWKSDEFSAQWYNEVAVLQSSVRLGKVLIQAIVRTDDESESIANRGVYLTPAQARDIAHELLRLANSAEEELKLY